MSQATHDRTSDIADGTAGEIVPATTGSARSSLRCPA